MTDKIVVLCNCATAGEAQNIARHLVEKRLAACVNVVPGVRSIYRWRGAIEEGDEWTLLIKSRRDLFDNVRAEIEKLHSYEVPEVAALTIVDISADYMAWMDHEISPGN